MAETINIRDFKAVAFDYDGIVADTIATHEEARRDAFEQYGKITGDERYVTIPDELHREAVRHGSNPPTIIGWILIEAGIITDLSDPHLANVVGLKKGAYLERVCVRGAEEIPGSVSLIRRLYTHRPGYQGIATTAARKEVLPFLNRFTLHRVFPDNRLVTHEEVEEPKPDPEVYLRLLHKMRIRTPEDVLAIEDAPHGIEAAKLAGLTVVAVATTVSRSELAGLEGNQTPDMIFRSMHTLNAAMRT